MNEYRFILYIAGQTTRSQRAVANLRRICQDALAGQYYLRIIDVLEEPELAERQKILATPTLIKEAPLPVRWLIGDYPIKPKSSRGLKLPEQRNPANVRFGRPR